MKFTLIRMTLIVLLLSLAACSSPEASRTRGDGAGADFGNRRQVINMHEGSRPFYQTPELIPAQHPPLQPANQADELSRR